MARIVGDTGRSVRPLVEYGGEKKLSRTNSSVGELVLARDPAAGGVFC